MRRFATALYQSLYNANWLKAQRFGTGQAWGYFALLVVMFTLIGLVPAAVTMPKAIQTLTANVANNVPDFSATIKGGKLTVTTLHQPFVYRDMANNFLVYVDTVTTSTLAAKDFASSSDDVVVLVTASNVQMYSADNDSLQTAALSQVQDVTFSKAQLIGVAELFRSLGVMALLDVALGVLLYSVLFLSKLYVIFLVSIVVLLIGRFRGLSWKFREYFTVGLYAITLPSLVTAAVNLLGGHVPYLEFITLLAFMLALVWSNEESKFGRVV